MCHTETAVPRMTSTGNDRALNLGLLLVQTLKPCLKIGHFYQQTYFPTLLWFDPPSKIFTKKQWSFDWTWKDCLVTNKGPGRYPSCQQLVKTFCPHCRMKKWLYWQVLHFYAESWVISFIISKTPFNWWSMEMELLSWTIPLVPWANNR